MNKHIELVKKWLADPESVTIEELVVNKRDAYIAYAAASASAADHADAVYVAAYAGYSCAYSYAAYSCAAAADYAYDAADYDYTYSAEYTDLAAYWVKRYEELTNTQQS
tara:strand:+ start:808 stop:1134 length:327 start_codon:yes stop_codon:yes gene_type:complete